MKKMLNIGLALFLVLGLIGCADGIKTSDLYVPAKPGKGVVLTLDKVDGATNVTVQRKAKGAADWSDFEMSANLKALKETSSDVLKIVDLFVEPGKEYEYQITYRGLTLPTVKTAEGKAAEGYGEYGLNGTNVAYDDKTGIMKISSLPVYFDITVGYKAETLGTISAEFYKKDGTINWSAKIYNEDNYGKPYNLDSVSVEAEINGVTYSNSVNKEELTTLTKVLPETITVPDVRPELKVEATADGIKINVPEVKIDGLYNYTINRRYKTAANSSWQNEWNYMTTYNLSKKEVVDYFVKPGYIYQYSVSYRSKDWTKNIGTKWSNEVTATAGLDKLTFDASKKAEYDPKTGIMTFPELLGLKTQLDKINATKKIIGIKLNYNGLEAYLNNDTSSINWLTAPESEDYYGGELSYSSKNVECVKIDDVSYPVSVIDWTTASPDALPTSIKIPNPTVNN